MLKCPKIDFRETLKKRFPISSWLPKYRFMEAVSDFVAGTTVGLTLMPQAIAYAALAGLEPQYGLYSSFAGGIVYIFFGTIKQVSIGPTAILSLLTYTYTHDTNPDFVVLLCFLSGVLELLCGILHLGFIVEFVSVPVTAGFSSAAAIIIATSQLKGLLGIPIKSEDFIGIWNEVIDHINETRPWDLMLSIFCCTILLAMRKLKDVKIKSKNPTILQRTINQVFWLLSTARNAIIVIICPALAYYLTTKGLTPFLLTGNVTPGLPVVSIPPFSTIMRNETYNFIDMCSYLGSGIIVVPLVALLENVAIAKAFANGQIVDATQEMIALGLCNIIGSFFKSIPVSGSFSRSAVNNASGAKTPFGGLYTAALILLALSLLTPYFFYIPKATLASVIFCALLFMIEFHLFISMWRTNRRDLIPALATFVACLWDGIEIGILTGIVVDLVYLLYLCARPNCKVERKAGFATEDCIIITPSSGLLYPTVDYIRTQINEKIKKSKNAVVIFDCSHISNIDFTGIQGLKALINDMKKRDQRIIFHKMDENVSFLLARHFGTDYINSTSDENLAQLIKGSEDSINGLIPYNHELTEAKLEMDELRQVTENTNVDHEK